MSPPPSLTAFLLVVTLVPTVSALSINMNYGSVADNLPPPPQVAAFVRDRTIIVDKDGDSLFCVARTGASDEAMQSCIDFVCGGGAIDCSTIQPGGPCFEPNRVQSHASYLMNEYYHKSGKKNSDCYFDGTGVLTTVDPSHGTCKYDSS